MERVVVSNKDESIRLFKNPFLEKLTHIPPWLPFAVYGPVVLASFYFGALRVGFAPAIFDFLFGVFLWTLFEYAFHRFLFHFKPASKPGKYLVYLFHGIHHDYPRDSTRLVMLLSVSIPLCLGVISALSVFGLHQLAVFSGVLLGYLAYDGTHFAIHHFSMTNKWFQIVKANHLNHHYNNPNQWFGVSNPLWDMVFGTYSKKKEAEAISENSPVQTAA